jgi:hypothetical protein
MTIERRIVVGLDDITGVTLECLGCHSKLTLLPDQLVDFPHRCPRCPQQWIPPDPTTYSSVASPFSNFLRSITQLRTLIQSNAVGVIVLLEFQEPNPNAY